MTKEIKKYYHYLDLPYSATEEDVKVNEKARIKIIRAKAIKTGKNSIQEVHKVADASNKVIEHIKKNGVGTEHHSFVPVPERIGTLVFALILFIIMFVSSIIALL